MGHELNIGALAAVALWFTWREIVPALLKRNGRGNNWQQVAILEEIRTHMQKTNEVLAVLLDRSGR